MPLETLQLLYVLCNKKVEAPTNKGIGDCQCCENQMCENSKHDENKMQVSLPANQQLQCHSCLML